MMRYTKQTYRSFAGLTPDVAYMRGELIIELFRKGTAGTADTERYFMCVDKKDVYEVTGTQYRVWLSQHELENDTEHNERMMKACLQKAEEQRELSQFFMNAYNTYKERLDTGTEPRMRMKLC